MEAPDRTGREAILKVHVSKKELPLAQDVDLGDIASMTTGFTGYSFFRFFMSYAFLLFLISLNNMSIFVPLRSCAGQTLQIW